jgi:hypothetical protein
LGTGGICLSIKEEVYDLESTQLSRKPTLEIRTIIRMVIPPESKNVNFTVPVKDVQHERIKN